MAHHPRHTLFVDVAGTAYSCGRGGDGRLGLGDARAAAAPRRVLGLAGRRV